MKTLALLILTAALTGCISPRQGETTEQTEARKLARISLVCEDASFIGATYWLQSHPDDRPQVEAAYTGIALLAGDPSVTAEQLADAVSKLPIRQLKGKEGAVGVAVNGAFILWDNYASDPLNANVNAHAALTGLKKGLGRALGK